MLSFSVASSSRFGPRRGDLTLLRATTSISISTPGLMVATSRGVVSHLGRDQYKRTPTLRVIQIPFESFLENSPPTPTLQPGLNPLHTFLGFNPDQHLLALTLRDPADPKETPANGHDYISASTGRGMKKITPAQWRTHARACAPDLVVALPDIPWTLPPFSQKRTTKSIERTAAWLAHMLEPAPQPLNILVHMAGGITEPARRAFTDSLTETLHGKEAENVRPHKCLDDGVSGYVFDLASLTSAPSTKLRVVNSVASPHEILRLVRDVGVDIFDSKWAQDAAHLGVALDFTFPVPTVTGKQRDLGHNLFRAEYAHDFSLFSDSSPCLCGACAPVASPTILAHSVHDVHTPVPPTPYTRAYVHHLLHTHEMSAHALLVMHNLAVLDAFFAGVRGVIDGGHDFNGEVERFADEFDEAHSVILLSEARTMWKDVDMARGKGRMTRPQ
ncbi:tRNA-guanine(15) transglycosylase-like protein [Mycena filopes]|nr:tRNA-guanine(15) transglycosylase-like protein [Mycena filopes]